ncbi:MAG: ABC transporter permease [Anaerolineales bacterium]|jgi:peptide/nickel transport system permease protein
MVEEEQISEKKFKNTIFAFLLSLSRHPVIKSVLRALFVSVGVLTISFALIRLIPGDPVEILLAGFSIPKSEDLIREYREILGLNGTLLEQYISYVSGVIQGDLGTSLVTRRSVAPTLIRTFPVTAWLIFVTIFLTLIMAIPLGVLAAIYRRTWFEQLFRFVASILLATPGFYLGLLLILILAIQFDLAPVAGYVPSFPTNLSYLWLPALTMSGVMVPILARVLQSSIIETMEQEFVESAIVRGLPRFVFTWRYLLRPSLAPTVSLLGYMIGQMLSATVVVEIVFNIPGVGTALVVEGVLVRDYPMVQAIVLISGLVVVIVSFLSDTLSSWLDPRTKII